MFVFGEGASFLHLLSNYGMFQLLTILFLAYMLNIK